LNDEEPTIGYHFDDSTVLTYTLSFDDTVTYSDMPETDMPLFGKDYYVLDATSTKLTLLNSAEKTIVEEGQTLTVNGHSVSISWIDANNDVKFLVDGETTDKLDDGEYYELDDGSYIVLSEGLYSEKDGYASRASFSLGSGKVLLENGQEVEVNEDAVDGLTATLGTNGTAGYFDSISIAWATDGDVFLTEGETMEMPVFNAFSLIFNGMDFGSTTEDIVVENGDTLVLSMGNYEVDMLFNDTSDEYAGGEDAKLVTITASESNSQQFAIGEDQRILATVLDTRVSDVETAYYEVGTMNNDTAKFDLTLDNLIDGEDDIDFVDESPNADEDLTDAINLKVIAVYDDNSTISDAHSVLYNNTEYAMNNVSLQNFAVVNVSSDSTIHWDVVVSEEGMIIEIPTSDSDTIDFYEAADDGDLTLAYTGGTVFKMAVDHDSDDGYYAKYSAGVTMVDETADDKTVGYDASVHASKLMFDSDVHSAEVEYYAEEVTADLALVAGGDISSTTEGGVMSLTDSEAMSMTSKNLVVVGGSAINSITAKLLGSAYHGEEFTAVTDVAAGEFLIQSFAWGSGKTALLVAGYNAEDTTKASTALMASEDLDVTVGKKYVSSTDTVSETNLVAA
jgi:hypothetical protein